MKAPDGFRSAIIALWLSWGLMLSPSIVRASEHVQNTVASTIEAVEFGPGDKSWLKAKLGKWFISRRTLRIAGDEWNRTLELCNPQLQKETSGRVSDLTECTNEREEQFDRRMVELWLMKQQK